MSVADRAIELIKTSATGSMRSTELEMKLGITGVAAHLHPRVKDGTLITCKVERPGLRSCNEYRLSVAGGGRTTEFNPLRNDASQRQHGLDAMQAAKKAARLVKQPAPANGHDALERGEDLGRRQVAAPEPKTPRIGAIEKGVPIPVRNNHGEIRAAVAEMEPGDSRLMSFTKQAIQYAAKQLKVRVTIGKEGEAGDHRVWLIGPKDASQ